MTSTRTGVNVLDGNLEAVEGTGLGGYRGGGRGIGQSRVPGGVVAGRAKSAGDASHAELFESLSHLGELHLAHEAHAEVLEDDAVGGGEEGENVRDEVLLIIGEVLPVLHVVGQVDLLGCRDGGGDGKCPG